MLAVLFAVLAVASAADWRLIDTNVLTTDLGVAFITESHGYTAGDANGKGPVILKTTDGGHNFESCNATFGPDVLLLDCDAALSSVVVSSVFGELYSTDSGRTFQLSRGGGLSQSVRYIGLNGDGGKKYGVTGQYGKKQGVAISTTSGRFFTAYDASLFTLARYGAFPTDDVWYVAAGDWPDSQEWAPRKGSRHWRSRRTQYLTPDGKLNTRAFDEPKPVGSDTYHAQISKTEDGGKTWHTVFAENGTFYFNGIDCAPNNASQCCAVGEASDTNVSGARIHCTLDGGKTWTRNFWAPSTSTVHYSLIEMRYASDTEVWAVGGLLTRAAPSAWFVHSSDGGKTWTPDTTVFHAYYALGISMVSGTVGYAAVDNLLTQESGIAKYGGV